MNAPRSSRLLLTAAVLVAGCRAPLPGPSYPLVPTEDAAFRGRAPEVRLEPLETPGLGALPRSDGLQIRYLDQPQAPTTVFLWGSQGAALERPQAVGAAELTARAQGARLRGLLRHAEVGTHVDLDGMWISFEVPASRAEKLAPDVARVLATAPNPAMLRAAQSSLQHRLQREARGHFSVAERVFAAARFGDSHALGLEPKRVYERAKRLTAQDVDAYWDQTAQSGRRILVVVGHGAAAAAAAIARIEAPARPETKLKAPWPPPPPAARMKIRVIRRNVSPLVMLRYTFELPTAERPEAELTAQVLGGALMGRLGDALRLDTGHSYSLQASLRTHVTFAELSLFGNVSEDDVPMFIERAGQVVADLKSTPTTPAELERAVGRWRGGVARALSTRSGTATLIAEAFLRFGEAPRIPDRQASLQSVSPERIRAFAARLVPASAVAVVFARQQSILPLSTLGEARQLDLDKF